MKVRIFGLLFSGIFAAAFGGVGTMFYLDSKHTLEQGIKIDGLVIDNQATRDSDGDLTYSPVVEYVTEDGQTRTTTPSMSSNPPAYSVGDNIPIAYMPETPDIIIINTKFWTFWFPMIFISVGAVAGFIFLMILISTLKHLFQGRSPKVGTIRSRSDDNIRDTSDDGFIQRY